MSITFIIICILLVSSIYFAIIVHILYFIGCTTTIKPATKWCEEDQLIFKCVSQPFNTLSNVVYLIPMIIVLSKKIEKDYLMMLWGLSSFYIAVTSTLYHGTNNRGITGRLDTTSIVVHMISISCIVFRIFNKNLYQSYITRLLVWIFAWMIPHIWEFASLRILISWRILNFIFIGLLLLYSLFITGLILYNKQYYILALWLSLNVALSLIIQSDLNNDDICVFYHLKHACFHISTGLLSIIGVCLSWQYYLQHLPPDFMWYPNLYEQQLEEQINRHLEQHSELQ